MDIQVILNAQIYQEYEYKTFFQFLIRYKYIGMQRNAQKQDPFWVNGAAEIGVCVL